MDLVKPISMDVLEALGPTHDVCQVAGNKVKRFCHRIRLHVLPRRCVMDLSGTASRAKLPPPAQVTEDIATDILFTTGTRTPKRAEAFEDINDG